MRFPQLEQFLVQPKFFMQQRIYLSYRLVLTLFMLINALSACQNGNNKDGADADSATKPLQTGIWRAVLNLDEEETDPQYMVELPFNFEVQYQNGQCHISFINGEERIVANEITFPNADSIVVKIPAFNSEIRGKINTKRILGKWYNFDKGDNYQIPFYAIAGDSTRFFTPTTDSVIQVAGKWEVMFVDIDKKYKIDAIGEFQQKGNQVTGTFITPTGDYRYLQGIATDHEVKLSCFDGAHAFLFVAGINNAGDLNGDVWYGKHGRETWMAFRNDTVSLWANDHLSRAKSDKFAFSFPDLNGNIVSLNDERFKNKVVMLQIMGSWCPNCMDETKLYSQLYQRLKPHGLEIVALAYERSTDLTTTKPILERYIKNLQVPYPILLAGQADKEKASATLPDLDAIKAYPTTIFIDRNQKVRRVHTGFSGPATSEYEPFVEELKSFLDQLLNEQS